MATPAPSSDDEEVAGDPIPRRRRIAPPADRRSASKRFRGGRSPEPIAEDEYEYACWLCEAPLASGTAALKGKVFHSECMAAVRCYRRLCGSDAGRNHCDNAMVAVPEKWREVVRPLVKGAGGGVRDAAARITAARKIREMEQYKDTQHIRSKLILNRTRFRAYKRFWDGQGSSSAESEFERRHDFEDGEHDDGFEARIAVTDNERENVVKGDIVRTRSVQAPLSNQPSASGARGSDDRGGSGAGRWGHRRDPRPRREDREERRRRERSWPRSDIHEMPSGRRRLAQPAVADDGVATPTYEEVKRGRRKTASGRSASLESRRSAAASAPEGKHASRPSQSPMPAKPRAPAHESDSGGEQRSEEERPAKTGTPAKSEKKLTPVEFMQCKTELLKTSGEVYDSGAGPKSVRGRLQQASAKLSDDDVSQLEKLPKDTLDALAAADSKLKDALNELKSCKLTTWKSASALVDAAVKEAMSSREAAEQQLAALNYMVDKHAKTAKAAKNAARYVKVKLMNRLQNGGFARTLAEKLAKRPEINGRPTNSIKINAALEHSSPCLYLPDDVNIGVPLIEEQKQVGNDFLAKVCKFIGAMACLETKRANLMEHLRTHKDHTGAMTKVEVDLNLGRDIPGFADAGFTDHPGAVPWLVTFKATSQRCGPSAWPLPGYGCLILPCSDAADTTFFIMPATPVLSCGIALADLPAFLGTASGCKCFDDHAVLTRVPEKCALWVPFGWLVFPIAFEPTMPEPKDEESATAAALAVSATLPEDPRKVGAAVVWNAALPSWSQELAPGTRQAIEAYNETYLAQVAHKRAWTARSEFAKAFAEEVASLATT